MFIAGCCPSVGISNLSDEFRPSLHALHTPFPPLFSFVLWKCNFILSFINLSSPRMSVSLLLPSPVLHLHLGFTRLPKCFQGVRWLIGSHLLGESRLYWIMGNFCQDSGENDFFFKISPQTLNHYFIVFIIFLKHFSHSVFIYMYLTPFARNM